MSLTQVTSGMIADGAVTAQKLAAGAASISGEIKMWPTSSAPTGYMLCNGAAVSRTTYSALFAVIGTTFGAGDGSTTFNLPDLRDRFPVGAGTTYSANSQGGSKDAVVVSHTHTDSGHFHFEATNERVDNGSYLPSLSSTQYVAGGNAAGGTQEKYALAPTNTVADVGKSSTSSANISTTGSSGTNANLPPYLGLYFIIKT